MTLSDLKDKIAASKNKGWYQSVTLNLNYPYINYKLSLVGFAAIYSFALRQIQIFEGLGDLPGELTNSKKAFERLRLTIIQIINDDTEDRQKWSSVVASITNINAQLLLGDIPETEFLAKLYQNHKEYYLPAFNFIIGNTQYYSKRDFTAYLLAYEFTNKEGSKIVERKEIEKRSIARLRSDFEKQIGESETQIVEQISNAKEKVNTASLEIDELIKQKEGNFNDWFDGTQNDFVSFFKVSQDRIKELENLYQEKLKLEAPAKYWNDRAKKLRSEGRSWLIAFAVCIAVGVLVLLLVLNMIANGTLIQVFSNTATAIKWSIALITLISFIAYAIKIVSKLTFSSFHLVRDAEEREQLTYVYLALKNQKGIDDTERHLIMQSLFSRADTGLLKEDASPTMPGNIVDKIMTR